MTRYTEGQKFRPSARAFNALERLVRDDREDALSSELDRIAPDLPTTFVQCRVAHDVIVGSPVVMTAAQLGQVNQPRRLGAAMDHNFNYQQTILFQNDFFGVAYERRWLHGIAAEPIRANKIGRVAIEGLFVARLKFNTSNEVVFRSIHVRKSTDADRLTHFQYDPLGPHRILYETLVATGDLVAVVHVNAGWAEGCLAHAMSSFIGNAGDVGLGKVWQPSEPNAAGYNANRLRLYVINPSGAAITVPGGPETAKPLWVQRNAADHKFYITGLFC